MKIGLQLYTIRDSYNHAQEFKESLKRVKELGYDQVEFAGYGDLSAVELRQYLDEVGLQQCPVIEV